MAELTIDAADIAAVLRKHVEGFKPAVDRATVGRVLEVGDGIARVAGLPGAAVNELLEFEGGALGLALNLEEETIGAVILGAAESVEEGQLVTATGRILSIPVGDGLLGGKYVRIEPGHSEKLLEPNGQLTKTRDVVVLEQVLGRAIFLLTEQ